MRKYALYYYPVAIYLNFKRLNYKIDFHFFIRNGFQNHL